MYYASRRNKLEDTEDTKQVGMLADEKKLEMCMYKEADEDTAESAKRNGV